MLLHVDVSVIVSRMRSYMNDDARCQATDSGNADFLIKFSRSKSFTDEDAKRQKMPADRNNYHY
ncbi:hypothetical protein KP509_21G084600 [Ceratopteris richardii]|uniref:Uncharacterized protein n=1 Tax=Ceratopteris richardii TaxID=49495 RepID=A0A8T2SCL9_CERRI|nr:hypothetical protein KP509_21G084600 [Ceratopteris richardii]